MDDRTIERRLRRVAWSMAAGSAFDLIFAAAILGPTAAAARLLGLRVPEDPVYLHLTGVLLLILGGMYLLPVADPRRYLGVAGIAAAGRLVGAVFLAGAFLQGRPVVFLVVALADLTFAAAHALLLRSVLVAIRGQVVENGAP